MLEVVSAACTDVEIKLESHDFGGCAIDATGEPLPESTLKACQEADAILLGELRCITALHSSCLTRIRSRTQGPSADPNGA